MNSRRSGIGAHKARINAKFRHVRTGAIRVSVNVIDPRKTRSLLCEFARLAEPIRTPGPVSFAIRP
jgi:hypothetical protein